MSRTYAAPFITQKDADFAKPFLYGSFLTPLGFIHLTDRFHDQVTVGNFTYQGLIASWGSLEASLKGFGEAFASLGTTVEILNTPEINGRRFSTYIPRFLKQISCRLTWAFQDPDDPLVYYSEVALKGHVANATWDYDTATLEVVSEAERALGHDVLRTIDDPEAPDPAVRRPLPIMINAADKMPIWIYGPDRSKFVFAEDIRPMITYFFGSLYYRGAELTEIETSAENVPPEP
jgi:hypothetical protein